MEKKILVVEDDENNLYVTTHVLKKAMYQVREATHGIEALEVAKKQRPDLILLDIALPQMDGYEVIKRLRNLQDFYRTPIIALTAHSMPADFDKIIKSGFTDYITKPVGPRDLVNKVGQYLLNRVDR